MVLGRSARSVAVPRLQRRFIPEGFVASLFCSSNSDSSDRVSGAASDHGAGDGAENEHAGQQQSQHAAGGAAHEPAVPPQHTAVRLCTNTPFTAKVQRRVPSDGQSKGRL